VVLFGGLAARAQKEAADRHEADGGPEMLVCPNCGEEIDISEVGEVCTNCGIQVPLEMEKGAEEDSESD
jgi:hypothetical protein